MSPLKIISVVGARPNFMKISPFIRAIEAHNSNSQEKIEHILAHTGQHYDDSMSRAFFEALDIPEADINLGVGSGSHAEQVGNTMIAFEKVVRQENPDWVVVVGDVNATCACSITAKKEHVRLAHIEAGLRSGDMTMPEEINRIVTDRLSDLLFTPDRLSGENLLNEGVPEANIKFVGNIMIDTLEAQRHKAEKLSVTRIIQENMLLDQSLPKYPMLDAPCSMPYAVITLHRPSNVDDPNIFSDIVNFLATELTKDLVLLWTIHPRAEKQLKTFDLWERVMSEPNLIALKPLGYHELLRLNMDAAMVLTDSGGLQEECCVLGTSWREHGGASVLVGNDVDRIRIAYKETRTQGRKPLRPELWDGKTADRIVAEMVGVDEA